MVCDLAVVDNTAYVCRRAIQGHYQRFHCLAHILGHKLAVRSWVCHQLFFVQFLQCLQGLAGGQAIVAVCFSL